LKAYGAGLLSSFGELEYCLSEKPELRPFDPEKTGVQDYPITEYQPIYYVAESFQDAKDKLMKYAETIPRPFGVRYNPYTLNVEILESKQQLENLLQDIKHDLNLLQGSMAKIDFETNQYNQTEFIPGDEFKIK